MSHKLSNGWFAYRKRPSRSSAYAKSAKEESIMSRTRHFRSWRSKCSLFPASATSCSVGFPLVLGTSGFPTLGALEGISLQPRYPSHHRANLGTFFHTNLVVRQYEPAAARFETLQVQTRILDPRRLAAPIACKVDLMNWARQYPWTNEYRYIFRQMILIKTAHDKQGSHTNLVNARNTRKESKARNCFDS